MKRIVIGITAAAFLGAVGTTVTPAPASAFVQLFFVPVLLAKQDPNFKATNPYAAKVSKKAKKSKKM